MTLSYGTRSRQYVDLSDADTDDRIRVTLEGGRKVVLQVVATERHACRLIVDQGETTPSVLEELFDYIHVQETRADRYRFEGLLAPARALWWRLVERKEITREMVRAGAELEVFVRHDGDAFDDSPRVGERLCIMASMPKCGGGGFFTKEAIVSVEFYRV